MESKDFLALQDVYKVMYEQKAESPEKEEEDRKKDDDLAGSPNKNGDDKKDKKNGKKKAKRWWDDDGDGIGYEKGEVKEAVYGGKKEAPKDNRLVVTAADKKANTKAYQNYKAGNKAYKAADHLGEEKKKKHDCASKVKHEEFGIGDCISEAHDLDENGNVAHYDVEFKEYIVKNVPVEELEILEAHVHEHVIHENKKSKKKNCGCGQDPCVTYGKQEDVKEGVYEKQKEFNFIGRIIIINLLMIFYQRSRQEKENKLRKKENVSKLIILT